MLKLLGDSTVDADAEIIAMVIDCLKKAGLKEFQLSVGHAEFFRGLTDAAGLKEEQEEELHDLISNKNYFGVTEFAETLSLNENYKGMFTAVVSDGFDELPHVDEALISEFERYDKRLVLSRLRAF